MNKKQSTKAIISNEAPAPLPASSFELISIAQIRADPNQPRKHFSEGDLQELIQSIQQHGILQPVLLRPTDSEGNYQIVCGERRYRAALASGLTVIPATIRTLSDEEALEIQVIENLQRKDVLPMEEAVAFKLLRELEAAR